MLSYRMQYSDPQLPHMLFYGPPGTGKTSTILALARELYGPQAIKSRVLELNASDERGIDIVRDKIKTFAKIAVSQGDPAHPSPPFKIIILDEADSMTQDAQSALRRTMELYSKITRFCLICNYVTRIIEPIASRCSKFRFKPLDIQNTRSRLEEIADWEGVNIDSDAIDTVISAADGDLRKAITYMQSASRLHKDERVTSQSIRDIAGVIPQEIISRIASAAESKQFDKIKVVIQETVQEGYGAGQIVSQLHDTIIAREDLDSKQKAIIALEFGSADKHLTDGADEELQILNLILRISAAM